MKNNILAKINLSEKPLNVWRSFSNSEKVFFYSFFNLKKFDKTLLKDNKYFKHRYRYQLNDDDIARVIFCLVISIIQYNKNNKMSQAFFGNSGGLDSATTCGLLSKAQKLSKELNIDFNATSFGLPIKSNPEHNQRAVKTANFFKIKHIAVDNLDLVFDEFNKALTPISNELNFNREQNRRAFGNVKARMRMIVNFFATTKSGAYVISTDNLSELYMAFWTLMGDVGAFGPIQNILKGLELPSIALTLGVPIQTLEAKPTDGLNVHKSLDGLEGGDSDAFRGIEYPHLDAIICLASKKGLKLNKETQVSIDHKKIKSSFASQETIDYLIGQMTSPASVWKRTKGSIGSSISRQELGLKPLEKVVDKL